MTWTRGSAVAAMHASSAVVAELRRARSTNPAAAMRAYTVDERREASAD
jgi:ribulose bisphosphate carboxylase small subunit